MTQTTNTAYVQWQDDVKTSFVQVATSAMVQYTERFLSMPESGDIEDEAFVEIVLAIVRLHAEGGEQWLSTETGLDLAAITSWLHGGSLPKLSQRQLILKLCISEALGYVNANPLAIVTHLISVEDRDFITTVTPRKESVLMRPVFTMALESMQGFGALPVRLHNSLKNDGVWRLGDLLATSEAALMRIPNLGRKSINELKEWLLRYKLSFAVSKSDVMPVLEHWKSYHTELPRPHAGAEASDFKSRHGISLALATKLHEEHILTYGILAGYDNDRLTELLGADNVALTSVAYLLSQKGLSVGMTFPKWEELRP